MINKMNDQSNDANEEYKLKALETHSFRMAALSAKEMTVRIREHDDEDDIYGRIAATAKAMANAMAAGMKLGGETTPDAAKRMKTCRVQRRYFLCGTSKKHLSVMTGKIGLMPNLKK